MVSQQPVQQHPATTPNAKTIKPVTTNNTGPPKTSAAVHVTMFCKVFGATEDSELDIASALVPNLYSQPDMGA